MKKPQINIAIAEDHDLVREGFISLLQGHDVINVMFGASNGKELFDKLKINKPDIILLDLEMPVMSGKEAIEKIKQRFSKIKIIIITATFSEQIVIDCLKKGADSFLPKNCKLDKLITAIMTVQSEGSYLDDHVTKILKKQITNPIESQVLPFFSELEKNIIKLSAEGLTSKESGEKLHINHRTIEWHKSQMIKRLEADNFATVIAYSVKQSII